MANQLTANAERVLDSGEVDRSGGCAIVAVDDGFVCERALGSGGVIRIVDRHAVAYRLFSKLGCHGAAVGVDPKIGGTRIDHDQCLLRGGPEGYWGARGKDP